MIVNFTTYSLSTSHLCRFPLKNSKILAEWIKFTNRGSNWKPSRWNSICSRHFDKSDFREYLSRKCLKKDAIPSIVTKNNISYETYHISTGSNDDIRTMQSEQDDYEPPIDDSKTSSELIELCRLCGDRAENLTCNSMRSLDDPEVNLLSRKCFPTVNIHSSLDQIRIVCTDCIAQLKQFSDFIDKVLSYQRELGYNEPFDSYATSENSLINGNRTQCGVKASTPNPSTTAMFIKQEPINVKQEIIENSIRRPFTTQVPTTSPSLCVNPFTESKKFKGFVQQEIILPKTEIGSTYCRACDRIFGNNFEFRSHNCSSAEPNMEREQGNNCEIMEVITLNNPVSFIDLAEDENGAGNEQRKPKTESFSEFERRERLEFEHAYAKRAANAHCNLKEEIIDSYNDNSQDGYDHSEQITENDEHNFNQNTYFEDAGQVFIDCLKCNQSFVSQELMDEHVERVHPVKPKICPICSAAFKSSKEYLLHKSKMHSQRFQCKRCRQKFNTQPILRFHEQRCTRESKDFWFSCRHCGKKIRNLAVMKKHLGICTGKQSVSAEELLNIQTVKNAHTLIDQDRFACPSRAFPQVKDLVSSCPPRISFNSFFSLYFFLFSDTSQRIASITGGIFTK